MKKVIAYYRVSTNDQNLGISAQKEIVRRYCEFNSTEILSEYEEHESGKKNDRPQLATALAESVKNNAYLIVAKIDRLTRVAYFGLQLCEKYRIIFCDHPDMGTLEQSIYFGMAQQEREYISIRTKSALAVLKAKGVKIALATSKPYEFSIKILKHFDLYQYFDFFGAATMDGKISKKEDVIAKLLEDMGVDDKTRLLMIGDRYHDIEGAKANALDSAGVLWGYGSKEELENAGADYILNGPADILELF